MEGNPRLLAPAPRVSVHLAVTVGAVKDPNRLQSVSAKTNPAGAEIPEWASRVMGKPLNDWRLWLQTGSAGVLILALLAPLSEPLEKVLQLLALVGMLAFLLTDSTSRREAVRFLIPLTALVLLALLVSVDPKWVFLGFIGVYAGVCVWEVFTLEHAEYLAERKHPR